MSPIPDQPEENFDEAAKKFDLERLRAILEAEKQGEITAAAWRYFKGVLCLDEPKEVAKKCFVKEKTVQVALNREIKDHLLKILHLPENQRIDWSRVPDWLLKAEYGKNQQPISIDWQQVCREVLENQNQWLTTHALGSGNRRVSDMYVPLELVERKQPPRLDPNIPPEKGSEYYQEKRTPIKHEDFFEQVLMQGISLESKGRRIAIIGEPGAGKTTLLQEIASRVEGLPIWVDLAELNPQVEDSLENYLLQKWLKKKASPVIPRLLPEVVPSQEELEKAFKEAFYQNPVWLLLDGANEIPANLSNPLTWIDKQIREGWIAEARVVLNCRLNVGDIHNDLPGFDIYCNRDFSYPEQVEEFIDKWFVKKAEQELRDNLKAELRRANERIQNLIINPLRLMLLCRTWEDGVKLQDTTKAGLYQRLEKGFYKLKNRDNNPKFKIDRNRQEELKRKLGKLALQAIDSKDARFRLRESSIEEFLGYPDQEDSLFWIARELGWLNQVGLPMVEEKDSDENVYAFFHPTFQEYFAACAINEDVGYWNFFLPRAHKDRPVTDKDNPDKYKRYRIFEPQWKEVILLWLGHQHEGRQHEKLREQKEKFIKALVEFCDGCDSEKFNFYWYRAYFLAAEGIREFPNCNLAKVIVEQVAIWACTKRWLSSDPLSETARETLRYTDQSRAIDVLRCILHNSQHTQHEMTSLLAATGLVAINPSHQAAISTLTKLMNNSHFEPIGWLAARVLLNIFPHHLEATQSLIDTLAWEDKKKSWQTFYEKSEEIANLIRMLCSSSDRLTRLKAAQSLMEIREVREDIGDYTLSNLIESVRSNKYGSTYYYFLMTDILEHIGFANKDAINFLVRIIDNSNSFADLEQDAIDWIRRRAIDSLGKIALGDLNVVKVLAQLMYDDVPIENRYKAAINLGEAATYTPISMFYLIEFICTGWVRRNEQNNSLGTVSNFSDFERPEFNAWYMGNDFYQQAPELLHAATKIIFAALTQGNFYQTVVTKLSGCLQEDTDNQHHSSNDRYESCYQLIWHCAQNMSYPDFYQAWHRQSTTTHPEAPDNIPVGNSAEAQILDY